MMTALLTASEAPKLLVIRLYRRLYAAATFGVLRLTRPGFLPGPLAALSLTLFIPFALDTNGFRSRWSGIAGKARGWRPRLLVLIVC